MTRDPNPASAAGQPPLAAVALSAALIAVVAGCALPQSEPMAGVPPRHEQPSPYKALVLSSGKCLDVQGDARRERAPVRVWDCNGTPNQQFARVGRQLVHVQGLCVEAARPTMDDNGGVVMLWRCHGSTNQQWSHLSSGQLRNGGGKCLDAHGPTHTRNGGKVHLWACQRGDNQRWAWR